MPLWCVPGSSGVRLTLVLACFFIACLRIKCRSQYLLLQVVNGKVNSCNLILIKLVYFNSKTYTLRLSSTNQPFHIHSSMQKLSNFLKKSTDLISQQTSTSLTHFVNDIQAVASDPINDPGAYNETNSMKRQKIDQDHADIIPLTVDEISFHRPLQNIELGESKIVQLQTKVYPENQSKKKSVKSTLKASLSNSRIHDIEQQKKRILDQLKKLDSQIDYIKRDKDGPESMQKSKFHKKVQISDDLQAKKQAQSLIKQLHLQKMKIEQKKRKMQEKQLEQRKRQQGEKIKQREELEKRLKEEKRQLIEKRMQEDRKKRQQRRMIDKQANILISELKKQEQFEKQRDLIPSQIQQYEQRKKLLEKKNIFNVSEIQLHQKKYAEMKSKDKELRRERSESIKVSHNVPKYAKNVWVERIQEEEVKRKEDEKIKELNKKMQLQKRMKYGDIVKNIFRSKHKKREQSIEKTSKQHSQIGQSNTENKPRTPDVATRLPQIPRSDQKRQNLTDKQFKQRQESRGEFEQKKSRVLSKLSQKREKQQKRQRDPQQVQKLQKQKQRQMQIRKQTKQRLKKLQSQSIDLPKPEKIKYENYISKVKVKKADPHDEWKRIMSNDKLSKEEKYKEMLSKATHMENQAKIKQDLRKNGDEDAVNLYIGSIQAKLALLQKF